MILCKCGSKLVYQKDSKTFYCRNCNQYYDINMNPITKNELFQKRQLLEQKQSKQYTPHCPTCGSPYVKKIGGFERSASVFTLGLFSKKINKSMKCENCGYTW